MSAPLLSSANPRFEGERLRLGTFEAHGPLLVLAGGWGALFQSLSGGRRLLDGRLDVGGVSVEVAVAEGVVGLSLAEPPLPPDWTLRELLLESAALSGLGRWAAFRRAGQVLGELGLGPLARKRLSRLRPAERRLAGVACALLGDPPVLALEQPFSGLEPSAQADLERRLEPALRGRAAIISVPALPGSPSEDALAAQSSELLFVSDARLVARGSYRELSGRARSYRVVAARSVDALLSRLGEAGYEVRRMLTADATTVLVTDPGGLGTVPLFEAALAADAPIIELVAAGLGAAPAAGAESAGA